MDASDEEKLKWVLRFNKFDLYTKNAKLPRPVEELKPYYQSLINKYFPNPILEW
jgi:inositol oxygenase